MMILSYIEDIQGGNWVIWPWTVRKGEVVKVRWDVMELG
jgi:hypothetical protein